MSCHRTIITTSNLTTQPQRPHARAPALNVTIQDGFSNGYIFMSPYNDASAPAPYIYDKFGNLVWDGYGAVGAANAHNFHVCSYQGVDHLCMMVGNQQEGLLTPALHFSKGRKGLTTLRLRIRHRHHRRQRLPHRRLRAIGRQHDARGYARIHPGGGWRDGSHHGVQHHPRRPFLPALQCY